MEKHAILLLLIIGCSHAKSQPPPWLKKLNNMQEDTGTDNKCFKPPLFCVNDQYRNFDGSCNNMEHPSWGAPYTKYLRTLNNNYADSIYAFPRAASGNELPSARKISIHLHSEKQVMDPVYNLNAMQWGQFIAHDMSLNDEFDLLSECCDSNQIPSAKSDNLHCAPIIIPEEDTFHGPMGHQCLSFMRSGTTWDHGCIDRSSAPEPISLQTSYMDLSMVYGVNEDEAMQLRTGFGGKLSSVKRNGGEFPLNYPNASSGCPFVQSQSEPCYLTGDIRSNQNPQLAILHILLLREHNRITESLSFVNPAWRDELLYQEARRINVAVYQHINYYEYLPIILGREHMIKNKLIYPEAEGYVNDYNASVNPSVSLEHASGANRNFHTQIRGYLQLAAENRTVHNEIRLSDWFYRPQVLEQDNIYNDLARGFTIQQQDYTDQYFSTEITRNFLRQGNDTFGNDLRSMDIQRGRDHGLGNYVSARKKCNLAVPKTFEDMTDFISPENVKILESLYESPQDVELLVAGSLERLVPGAQAGPTFHCILTDQFYRTRVGDRYFYENGADPVTAFTPSQLQSIRHGASMARLLCDNVDDNQHMQPHAFHILGLTNQLVPCESRDDLPSVNLRLWQENQHSHNHKHNHKHSHHHHHHHNHNHNKN